MDTMGFISASTNYNCTDCHVEPKVEGDWSVYAEETPRKATARRMILMVQAINKTNFGGARVVTCYTCHRNCSGRPKDQQRRACADQVWRRAAHARSRNEVEIRPASVWEAPPPIRSLTSISRWSDEVQKAAAITSVSFSKGISQGYARNRRRLRTIYVKAPNQLPPDDRADRRRRLHRPQLLMATTDGPRRPPRISLSL